MANVSESQTEAARLHELVAGVWRGDADATTAFVRRYERPLLRAIRNRMPAAANAEVSAAEIAQSAFGEFFVGAVSGKYAADNDQQVVGLLFRIADLKRKGRLRKVKPGRQAMAPDAVTADPRPLDSPSFEVNVEEIKDRLPPDIRRMTDMRTDGQTWDEIAAKFGQPRTKLEKAYGREFARVAAELYGE